MAQIDRATHKVASVGAVLQRQAAEQKLETTWISEESSRLLKVLYLPQECHEDLQPALLKVERKLS